MVNWDKEINQFKSKYLAMKKEVSCDNILYLAGEIIKIHNNSDNKLKDLNKIIYRYKLLFSDDLIINKKQKDGGVNG